jgi:subtilisin family serine protease
MTQHVRRRGLLGALALSLTAATVVAAAPPAAADTATERYIVSMVNADETTRTLSHLRREGRKPTRTFSHALHGFSARLTTAQVTALRADPDVTAVVPNTKLHAFTTQASAPWGLDRIDRRSGSRNGTYDYSTTGAGVTVFEIDTGIRFNHTQFGGRAVSGKNFLDDGQSDASDCTDADALGHGTHVAGIIGGSTYGVAKGTKLVALRALDCNGDGDLAAFLEALDWVVDHKPSGPAVVNISAGGDQNDLLDDTVQNVISHGIPVVVAAGNEDQSATHVSPANAANAITVGSTTTSDNRSSFSNYGKRIDIFAPGSGIVSAFPTSTTATRTLSGTSMATPFVTGAVARYLQAYPKATPAQVRAALVGDSTKDELSRLGSNSPDRMLYLRRTTTGAATGVTANHSTSLNKMRIRWSAPYGFGATAVTGYRVTRTGVDANGATFTPTVVSASARDYAWSNLKDSAYTVTVEPINASGAGPAVAKTD